MLVNLDGDNAGLSFQLKMLEFMDSMKQELKHGKEERAQQNKMIDFLKMKGTRLFSSIRKLAKVNMLSTFLRFNP